MSKQKADTQEEIKATETDKNSTNTDAFEFSKEQLIKSNKYGNRKDVLMALLEDDKKYSYSEVEQLIKEFLERKVK